MHGIGNDFVVIDCRDRPLGLDAAAIGRLGDRHFGVGFDQLLTIEPATDPRCAWRYGIYNADGSQARQCGNGARCVAAWLHRAGALGAGQTWLESPSGPVAAEILDDGNVRIDMGEPRFEPAQIPLDFPEVADSYAVEAAGATLSFGAVSMGNPHAVIEVPDVTEADVADWGPVLQNHPRFPRQCNVGFVHIVSPREIRLRVFERGVGETLACGSGACAAVAVLHRRGKIDHQVAVHLPGGELQISWAGPGHSVWMTGPAAFVFDGNYYP
ncbi:diaminopimelate epimerase [Tahibacter amnicola]|uniref:Diaminopimelate epimerase n=1 Tax=Tahibacter amnicola TaxID=2976241 RepID=A0ABY6BLG6_9GAMM|nr:diaminopimelate epimerase [Tahibacter amnicola]UXI70614.1 diaminopimelate epimerase [Tahibacter amnicola]